ncbi:MAG: NAD(P)-binding protein [Granulosicoccus sp.]|nr:NAD(P)-binding protein [Granulosicoccus sp.]
MIADRFGLLFEPIKIGPVTAPNRFYAVPHATGHGWNQPSGAIALRAMKAQGGWGTVAVQITEIAPDSDMANHPMERIWDDTDIPRHVAQVEAIKKYGSLAAIELGHGGMRSRNITSGLPVIGPSNLPVLRPEVPVQARAMDKRDIKAFRNSHKAAALRAKTAGYDIVYVYAAHDLSIFNHFLSPVTNQRSDEYGGSFDNRLRLLREVLEDTLEVAAGEQAVALRFSVAEPAKTGGISHEGEGRDVVEALAELPDLWDVNISGWSQDSATARFTEEGFQLPFTDFVKSITSKPVVGVGRFTSPDKMVAMVKKGQLDLIGAARPSIADPYLPTKIKEGRTEEIRECIGCNICVSMDSYGLPIRCTQNPTISEEWRSGWHPESFTISRNIKSHLIVGAGPAGLECALTLMRAGHKVTIAEAREEPGGRVTRESRLPGLGSWLRVRDYRVQQLAGSADAEIFLSSELNVSDIVEFGADNIILATGACWRRDGVGSTNFDPIEFTATDVVTPDDVMSGDVLDSLPSTCIVYDDDHFYMAGVIAEALCATGRSVAYVTPLPMIATWTDHTLEQERITERLQSKGVSLLPNVRLNHDATFQNVLSGETLDFDSAGLVMVGARKQDDALFLALQATPDIGSVYRVGDCLVPGIIQAAVLSGHSLARNILQEQDVPVVKKRDQISLLNVCD